MLYNQDIVEATVGVLNMLPDLKNELEVRGFVLDDAEFMFKVFDGKKDGSRKVMVYGRQFGTPVPDVVETAKSMEYISELYVTCTCYMERTCDYLNIAISNKVDGKEFTIDCWLSKETPLFISQKDLMRKLKNVGPAEEPVTSCKFTGSIHYIPNVLYPVEKKGAMEYSDVNVEEVHFLTRRSRFSNVEEHQYLVKLYQEILTVMRKSDTSHPESFKSVSMQNLIAKLPIGDRYGNYRRKLLRAAEPAVEGVGFRDPEVVQEFFDEYRKQVRKRCDDLKEATGISVEDYVMSSKKSSGENALMGLAEDIAGE